MSSFFHSVFYEPLYNALVFLVNIVPGHDIGIAVILLTILVKLLISPITLSSSRTQARIKEIEPALKAVREKHSKDQKKQAEETLKIYQEKGINPFSGFLGLIVQIPIIFALYFVFLKGLHIDPALIDSYPHLPGFINTALLHGGNLYPFVELPEFIRVNFLGLIDLTGKSLVLALLAGISQYFQMKTVMGNDPVSLRPSGSLREDLAQSMKFQMRYILPAIIFFVAYTVSSAVALYWVVSNVFGIFQERFARSRNTNV